PTPAEVVQAHLLTPPPSPSAKVPGLPPGFDEVVRTALAKNPDDRYPDCRTMAAAAQAALRPAPHHPGPAHPRPTPPTGHTESNRASSPTPGAATGSPGGPAHHGP